MGYVRLIKLFHMFTQTVRSGDFALHIFCLPKLAEYFFCFNHVNYARWIVKYHDNLLKLEETHPEVYIEFKNGTFSIRRTNNPFSRVPIDLTLEKTINADAACQRRGTVSLTNSISARQRWDQSHSIRTAVISHLFERVGLTK